MKYAIVLPDGAADEKLPQLNHRTPLQVAKIPHMDWVSQHGKMGRIVTVPKGFTPATDVATLSLFGYAPEQYYTGRAPLEAIARRLKVAEHQIIFRCNFVTILDGKMSDFTAGHIAQAEADALIATLNEELRASEDCEFHAGVSYRNLLLVSHALDLELKCQPPHDIPDQPVEPHWPQGKGQERVMRLMQQAKQIITAHPVNEARRKAGKAPVTNIWLWGQGRPTVLPSFESRFGLRGAAITGVDIIRGLALGMGMKLLEVPGATGYIDTNFIGKGEAAVAALENYDVVVCHIEAADEAGHLGDAAEKVRALEKIDEYIVGPLLSALKKHKDWRILVAPDHPTPASTKAHSAVPPLYCYAGSNVSAEAHRPFTEDEATATNVWLEPGTKLIDEFIG